VNVRQLAALDLHGLHGTDRRRRLVLVEFTAGAVAMVSFGAWLISAASASAGKLVGWWAVLAGFNYVPLAVHAFGLRRGGLR
jgi:hypothetical protein